MKTIFEVPALAYDAMMLKRFGQKVSAQGVLERRIVWNLCAHMEEAGWKVQGVHDGDEFTECVDAKAAMELIFDLDDAGLYFQKGSAEHRVLLISGNGVDMIGDWNYSLNDKDGFNAAMEAFDTETCA